jgi:hypothetical protein
MPAGLRVEALTGRLFQNQKDIFSRDPPLLHPQDGVSCKPYLVVAKHRIIYFFAWMVTPKLRGQC